MQEGSRRGPQFKPDGSRRNLNKPAAVQVGKVICSLLGATPVLGGLRHNCRVCYRHGRLQEQCKTGNQKMRHPARRYSTENPRKVAGCVLRRAEREARKSGTQTNPKGAGRNKRTRYRFKKKKKKPERLCVKTGAGA